MIEGFISSVVEILISQGGGWLVAVLLGVVVFVMDRRLVEQEAKNNTTTREHYEKRLDEFRELIEVVGASTHTIQNMQAAVNAAGDNTNQLVQAFARLLREVESQRTAQSKNFSDVKKRIEALQKGRVS